MEDLPNVYFMRARYYSAEAGVFLSTDPVKHIGPGWQPVAYTYASGNPLSYTDPQGEFLNVVVGAIGGALVGGGVELGSQFVGNLLSGKDVFDMHNYDGAKVAGAPVGEAITGAIASTGVGAAILANPAGAAAISALTSGTSAVAENAIKGNDLTEGVGEEMLYGAATGYLTTKLLPKTPNIGNDGQSYTGATRGVEGSRLISKIDFISYSHPRNAILQTVTHEIIPQKAADLGRDIGTQLRNNVSTGNSGGRSLANKTITAANNATSLNSSQSSKPASTCICFRRDLPQVKSSAVRPAAAARLSAVLPAACKAPPPKPATPSPARSGMSLPPSAPPSVKP